MHTISPAYVVTTIVLGEGLPLSEAVEALNLNGSAHEYPPIDGQVFEDMLQSLRAEQPGFYGYVECNRNETRGKEVLLFLKQGGMVYMEHHWLQNQLLLDLDDETMQAALKRYDF
ncbi:hypothetical protein MMC32_001407 [Xylographa parallela]|nr:hypothetical protein [Xylographa parallela]